MTVSAQQIVIPVHRQTGFRPLPGGNINHGKKC